MKKNTEALTTIETFNPCPVFLGETIVDTGITMQDVDGKPVPVYKTSYEDADGTLKSITCADKALLDDLAVLHASSQLDATIGLAKACACYHLSEDDNYKKVSADFKSINDMCAKTYSIKSETVQQYVRVGKYFVYRDSDKQVQYRSEWIEGASLTNLVQMLSLINDEAEDPLADIVQYVLEGKLHPASSFKRVKQEVSDIRSTINGGAVDKKSSKKKPDKDVDRKPSDVLLELLGFAEALEDEDKKQEAQTLIVRLQEVML